MLSVGMYGATGYMGAPFARALIKAHRGGTLRLVLLHRPESNLAKYPKDIEKRVINLEHDETADTAGKLKDLQVVISATSWSAVKAQYRLIDALKGSKELVTFFPSEYATPHSAEDLTSPSFEGNSREKQRFREYCAEKGVPCTRLANATTPELLFNFGPWSAFDARDNKLELYHPLGNGTRGLTSKEFSGLALLHLLTKRLKDLPNTSFSIVEKPVSAQELIEVFTKIHGGTPPTIKEFTEEDYQRGLRSDFLGAMGAASKKGLAVGTEWPGEIIDEASGVEGWGEKRSMEWYVRDAISREPLSFSTLRNTDLSGE